MSRIFPPSLMFRAAMMAALASLLLSASCAGHTDNGSQIKIGAPPGASLVLADYVAAKMGSTNGATPMLNIESFPDCCSANMQLALSSLKIDAALMCPDAAEALVNRDDRYSIVGPCLANSDILVLRGAPGTAKKIGISQNHNYQKDIVNRILGPGLETSSMSYASLSPAYERGDVDGVVIDIEGALLLTGTRLSVGGNLGDVVTYELVVRKDLPGLDKLKDAFASAATELSNPTLLLPHNNCHRQRR